MPTARRVPVSDAGSVDVVIATSASLSGAATLWDRRLQAIIIPAATEGASLTFQGSFDGTDFFNIYDGNGEYSITMTADTVLLVPIVDFLAFPYLKVRTGTAGSPTTQSGADATLTLIIG